MQKNAWRRSASARPVTAHSSVASSGRPWGNCHRRSESQLRVAWRARSSAGAVIPRPIQNPAARPRLVPGHPSSWWLSEEAPCQLSKTSSKEWRRPE